MKAKKIDQAKEFGTVAVLMGGVSAEREISIKSGMAVFKALKRQDVDVLAIDVEEDAVKAIADKKIERVFNIVHGRGGEDGVLQTILENLNIPYTGSGVEASKLTIDKVSTKVCWNKHDLSTPDWIELNDLKDIQACIENLGFPIIVKPALEGSSIGLSKASNKDELIKALQDAQQYHCQAFAESWVKGEEYTVAVLNGEALPVIRLETPHVFYDYEAKYQSNNTLYHCPCGLSEQQEEHLKALAVEACVVTGVTGWGRVDLFIDEAGKSQLIEVNTVPGMTDHSLVPMAAKAEGIEFDELVWRILETSMNE